MSARSRCRTGLSDEQALFLSDIFPTGYMGAEFCDIKGGETIAVFGCGPVAQFAIRSAYLLGAGRVIAIDTVPERLRMAEAAGAITIDFMKDDVYERIQELTQGRGADACIDAVGTEPHTAASFDSMLDRAKVAIFLGTDRPHVLRQAIHCTRNFGIVSIIGVYGGFVDKIPMGSAINRGLTFRMAQTPVQHYLPKLLRAHRGRRDRSELRDHPHRAAGARPGDVPDLPRQARRLHQGDAAPVTAPDGDRCMDRAAQPFAIVTGASSGIGFELAAGAGSGNNDKAKSLPRGWSSSMRPGRRPT